MKKFVKILSCLTTAIFFSIALYSNFAKAHPGNTASDGCHYCRTNCEKWGEVYGERHCHNGSSSTDSSGDSSSGDNTGYWALAIIAGVVITYFVVRKDK